jgi:hypothetical protein
LQQSIAQPPSQQFAAQSPLQQPLAQQSLHLSVQQAGQQVFAATTELCANALMASTTETERTASIRFILNLLNVENAWVPARGPFDRCSSAMDTLGVV